MSIRLNIPELIGKKFGKLMIVDESPRSSTKMRFFHCLCDCGNLTEVSWSNLRDGHTKSCGCFLVENAKKLFTKYGLSHTSEYKALWARQREDRAKDIDNPIDWSPEQEYLIHQLFPCCVVCGDTQELTTDHVKPLVRGNPLSSHNAAVLCNSCNASKGGHEPQEVFGSLAVNRIEKSRQLFMNYWGDSHI